MTDGGSAPHLQADELLEYFEEKLSDERQRQLEEHLARCDSCTLLARGVRLFDEAWTWTAEQHGVLHQRQLLARALEAAGAESPALRDRLRAWRERWGGLAEAGLRVAVEMSGAAARVVAESLDTLARPGSAWHFAPAPQAVNARGETGDASASALLTTPLAPATPRARVAVRGGLSTEVEIRLDDLTPDASSPIVLLIRLGEPLDAPRVRVSEAEPRPGVTYRIARFADVAPGEYLIAFEPLAS